MASVVLSFIVYLLTVVTATPVDYCIDDIFADPNSCDHFYKCDNGKPVLFNCPDKLFYNTATKGCDWPYKVNCDVNTGKRPESTKGSSGSKDENSGTGPQNGNNDYNPDNDDLQFNNDVSKGPKSQNEGRSSTVDGQDPVAPIIYHSTFTDFSKRPRRTIDDIYTDDNNPYEDMAEHERKH